MGKNLSNEVRMVITFYKGEEEQRSVHVSQTIPSMVVGQIISFDHPSMAQCLWGRIMSIQHTVFLDNNSKPVTYVDVEIRS